MRKGLTLIELIFTIVIIAMVFTVVPKIVLSLNKADSFVIRQDAMFNGISMMKMISNMPWDDNNTDSSDILHVSNSVNSNLDCNSSTDYYRRGSFKGSRTCKDALNARVISPTSPPEISYDENDIGDFHNKDVNASYYSLHVEVEYIEDNITYDYPNQKATITIVKDNSFTASTTNLKYVDINVSYKGKRGNPKQLTQFNYTSANIGQMILNKRVWQ